MAGIYIHIPFCRQACNYCNFHFSTQLSGKTAVVAAILAEMELRKHYLSDAIVNTIYIGGGTPSLLSRNELKQVTDGIQQFFPVASDAEFTLEANPDDINKDKLETWKTLGVNRLSIGIQSFRQEDLEWMNRAHTAGEARTALDLAAQAGFTNFSMDLIYGIPGLSDEDWLRNIDAAVGYGATHLSCYALTVEEKTRLSHEISQKKLPDVDPEQQSRQFLLLMDALQAQGYEHYEISNFARPGCRSRHNSAYWKGVPYLGLGPGAHSYDGNIRRWNISNNALYVSGLKNNTDFFDAEVLTAAQKFLEYVMTSLRTAEGIQRTVVETNFGATTWEELSNKAFNYQQLTRHEGMPRLKINPQEIRLTNQGKCFADGITAFFA